MYTRIFLFLLILLPAHLWAQERLSLTLENAIRLAQENSPEVRIARLRYRVASFQNDAFQARLKPTISLNGNIPSLTRRISNIVLDDGSQQFRTQSQSFSSLNLDIDLPLLPTGGNVSLSSGLLNIRNFEPIRDNRWQATPLLLNINQPLLGFNDLKWEKKVTLEEFRLARIGYSQAMENVATQMSELYFRALISQQDIERARKNVINNDTIFTISKGRFEVGKIAENELLQSELSVISAQANMENAQLDFDQSIQQIRTLLGLDRGLIISLDLPTDLEDFRVEPEFAVEQALQYNSAIAQTNLEKLRAEEEVAQAKSRNRFSADVFASLGLNQSANSIPDAYRDLQDRQFATIGISIPILQWGRRKAQIGAALAQQQITREETRFLERSTADEVYYQVLTVQQLRKQVGINARSDTLSQRRYDISRNRYLIGKISIQDLFLAQRDKDEAQEGYIRTLESYWLAYRRLRSLALFDFVEMKPLQYALPAE